VSGAEQAPNRPRGAVPFAGVASLAKRLVNGNDAWNLPFLVRFHCCIHFPYLLSEKYGFIGSGGRSVPAVPIDRLLIQGPAEDFAAARQISVFSPYLQETGISSQTNRTGILQDVKISMGRASKPDIRNPGKRFGTSSEISFSKGETDRGNTASFLFRRISHDGARRDLLQSVMGKN